MRNLSLTEMDLISGAGPLMKGNEWEKLKGETRYKAAGEANSAGLVPAVVFGVAGGVLLAAPGAFSIPAAIVIGAVAYGATWLWAYDSATAWVTYNEMCN